MNVDSPAPTRVSLPANAIRVGQADWVVQTDPAAVLIITSLGAGVGVAAYDPAAKVGALLHCLLPDSARHGGASPSRPGLYVDTGLDHLLRGMEMSGADRGRLRIIVAGGSQFLEAGPSGNLGRENVRAVRDWLAKEGLTSCGLETGGSASRRMQLDLATGKVTLQSPGDPPKEL